MNLPLPTVAHPALSAKLDHCVMCGMCSQHCPTYLLTADENESPRGRIALISAFLSGQLTADARLQSHLDHCTGCRACEAYCPSEVAFGAIMDEARALLPKTSPPAPHISAATGRWLRLYQRSGLQKLLRGSGMLRPLGLAHKEGLLPVIPRLDAWQSYYPPTPGAAPLGDVGLFTGCIANVFDREALDASRRLLNALGYGVHVPPRQGCCGAMALHSGQPEEAARLAQENIRAFAEHELLAIVHTASGCTAQLSEYPLLPEDPHQDADAGHAFAAKTFAAKTFAAKIRDISQFLSEAPWPAELQAAALTKTVALHTPCSLNNVLHQADVPRRLLQRIPKLEIAPLAQNPRCCGGGGQYLLEQVEFSRQLRERTLDNIDSQMPIDLLATSNLGCALQLAAGLRDRGQAIDVIHPVVLLARQLGLIQDRDRPE
ncbi:MAG: (Fe-S)-binding protein [Gammaproteobacteria bacterium]|nr:(Fe-S)-binding protein [Gammaproteobacteria bacterium]